MSRSTQANAQSSIAKGSTAVSVLTSSTVVAGDNPGRAEIAVVNDGANVVYLALATAGGIGDTAATAPTAVANSGIRLNANGGSWTSNAYTGPVAAIAASGTTVVTVVEV